MYYRMYLDTKWEPVWQTQMSGEKLDIYFNAWEQTELSYASIIVAC